MCLWTVVRKLTHTHYWKYPTYRFRISQNRVSATEEVLSSPVLSWCFLSQEQLQPGSRARIPPHFCAGNAYVLHMFLNSHMLGSDTHGSQAPKNTVGPHHTGPIEGKKKSVNFFHLKISSCAWENSLKKLCQNRFVSTHQKKHICLYFWVRMQEAKLLIPLLHSPMAEEQCHASRGGWERERQQQRGMTGHWTSLSSLPRPTTALCGCPYLFHAWCQRNREPHSKQHHGPTTCPQQAGLEGSITAKPGRGCSCALRNGLSGAESPAAHEAIYIQWCVFNIPKLHWGQCLNISSHMQVHGHTDVLAPEHWRAKTCGFLLQELGKDKNTLYLQSRQDYSMSRCALRGQSTP